MRLFKVTCGIWIFPKNSYLQDLFHLALRTCQPGSWLEKTGMISLIEIFSFQLTEIFSSKPKGMEIHGICI